MQNWGTLGCGLGHVIYFLNWDVLHISEMAEATNFKFGERHDYKEYSCTLQN